MNHARKLAAAVLLATLGGCATAPAVETSFSGVMPTGKTYALVDAGKYYGAAGLPVAALSECLAHAGMQPAAGGETLVHLAGTVRPVRTRLIVGDQAKARKPRSAKEREELVLGVTDAKTGALLVRASAARALPAGTGPGVDDVLPRALCSVLSAPAAKPR